MSVWFLPSRVYNIMLSTSLRQVTSHLIQYNTPKPFPKVPQSTLPMLTGSRWYCLFLVCETPLLVLQKWRKTAPFPSATYHSSSLHLPWPVLHYAFWFLPLWTSSALDPVLHAGPSFPSPGWDFSAPSCENEIKADSSWAAHSSLTRADIHTTNKFIQVFSFTKLRLNFWEVYLQTMASSVNHSHREISLTAHLENA